MKYDIQSIKSTIASLLKTDKENITEVSVLKKGMTNRSFVFSYCGKKYIIRVPGEGTDMLIDRKQESEVYDVISDKEIGDNAIYFSPENGIKITEFWEDAKVCDANSPEDVAQCMRKLRQFHECKLKVSHKFDIFEKIKYYECLFCGNSVYSDYEQTKDNVFSLKSYIDAHENEYYLTHIDAVPDNFLFINNKGNNEIRLIDWEYAAMQDQNVDLAMFCIYAMYDKVYVDKLIDSYYYDGYTKETRIKIYCYIAACGLLWSNWCEYKRSLGVDFGEYALRQYQYAKEYFEIVRKELLGNYD